MVLRRGQRLAASDPRHPVAQRARRADATTTLRSGRRTKDKRIDLSRQCRCTTASLPALLRQRAASVLAREMPHRLWRYRR